MATAFHFKLDYHEPVKTFACLHHEPYSLFFDSADRAHPAARYSFIAWQPFETIESWNGAVLVTNREEQVSLQGNPFDIVRERLAKWNAGIAARPGLPPFQGGAAGFFGYDLVRKLEKLPNKALSNPDAPEMAVGLYDKVIAYDHTESRAYFIVIASDEGDAALKFNHLKNAMKRVPEKGVSGGRIDWHAAVKPEQYKKAVQKVIDYIRAGDIFQANLSQRFEAPLPEGFNAFEHYKILRKINPAPFAAYMNFGSLTLSSASPERFLQVRGRQVETRPIKGTRPRMPDPVKDQAMQKELLASEKDRAENIMIVDLLRNDLSKVCTDESVEAPELCRLETFAGVHHLVSTVTGTLREKETALDALEACFPGGSITGAPKVRAMEIIEGLEPLRRGPYCGAMGYIGFNGAMDTNIVIRTLVYEGRKISFNAGGGITADSIPAAEYRETLDKAGGIFRSFEIPKPKSATGK